MSEELPLAGRVVAIAGTGSDADRAIAVACADAGADLALAALSDAREHVYGMNSIANEIWAIGRRQFVVTLDDRGLSGAVHDARERLGRCDALVAGEGDADGNVPVVRPAMDAGETLRLVVAELSG